MHARVRQPITLALAVALPVLLLFVGIWLGGHPDDLPGFLRSALVADHDTRVVNQAIDEVAHDYYRRVPRSALVNASIAGVVSSLQDRFSNYLTPAQYHRFDQAGSFSGIGVEVNPLKDGLRVVRIFDQSPAQRSRVHVGDLIIAVDGRSLAGLSATAATRMIEGPPGTNVTLTLQARRATRRLTITREVVSTPVVASALRNDRGIKAGVVSLAMFTPGSGKELRTAVLALLRQGARAIVLDLRQNGGGLVDEARLVASVFISQGAIVTTRGRTQPSVTLMAVGNAIPGAIPVVVLVDHSTASASEIVTGALQDHRRALVVGTHTFGKGVFQEVRPLSNGGALDITVGQYFTPDGHNLGGNGVNEGAGIQPDISLAAGMVDSDRAVQAALRTAATEVK
jgi:carboxyl-terminal processing protease